MIFAHCGGGTLQINQIYLAKKISTKGRQKSAKQYLTPSVKEGSEQTISQLVSTRHSRLKTKTVIKNEVLQIQSRCVFIWVALVPASIEWRDGVVEMLSSDLVVKL